MKFTVRKWLLLRTLLHCALWWTDSTQWLTNDRWAAGRELEIRAILVRTQHMGVVSAKGNCGTCWCKVTDTFACMSLLSYKRYHTIYIYNVLGKIGKACLFKWYPTDVCVIIVLSLYSYALITWQSEMAYLALQSMQCST